MKEKIRAFMDDLLKDVTKTRKVLELKEELIGNMEERYDDLIRQGLSLIHICGQQAKGTGRHIGTAAAA